MFLFLLRLDVFGLGKDVLAIFVNAQASTISMVLFGSFPIAIFRQEISGKQMGEYDHPRRKKNQACLRKWNCKLKNDK